LRSFSGSFDILGKLNSIHREVPFSSGFTIFHPHKPASNNHLQHKQEKNLISVPPRPSSFNN